MNKRTAIRKLFEKPVVVTDPEGSLKGKLENVGHNWYGLRRHVTHGAPIMLVTFNLDDVATVDPSSHTVHLNKVV